MTRSDFPDWVRLRQDRIERVLDETLPSPELKPQRLHQAMRYAALGGGKRVRALLAYAASEWVGADSARADKAAAAVELIHAYSLVHDDMPCMDDDVLRRGKPTCHMQYDEATALLVGDSLQSVAFEVLTQPGLSDDPAHQLEMLRVLAHASGSRGMAGGQAVDLASGGTTLTLADLEFMHNHKTGALIRAAVILGAACGKALDAQQRAHLDNFAKTIGLAFQVVDDVLDAEATTEKLGKTAGKDARQNKPTYVSTLGLTQARQFAHALQSDAHAALAHLPQAGGRLAEMASFIVRRDS